MTLGKPLAFHAGTLNRDIENLRWGEWQKYGMSVGADYPMDVIRTALRE